MRHAILIALVATGAASADRFIEHKERHLGRTGMFGVTFEEPMKTGA